MTSLDYDLIALVLSRLLVHFYTSMYMNPTYDCAGHAKMAHILPSPEAHPEAQDLIEPSRPVFGGSEDRGRRGIVWKLRCGLRMVPQPRKLTEAES